MRKNMGLIVLVIILSLLVLSLGGYILYGKLVDNDNNTNNTNTNINDDNKSYIQYSFGDEVIISKMSSVKGFYFGGDETVDFSKWYVLTDKDNIVTLYSDEVWGKDSSVKDYKYLFNEYGVNIEKVRGLDENDLELFGCDIHSLSCNKSPSWAKNSITSVVSEKSIITFESDKLSTIPIEGALGLVRPVIVITKSNLESAK